MTHEAKEFAERVVEVVRPDPWVRRLLALLGTALVVGMVVGLIGLYGAIRVAATANEQAAATIERLEASQQRSTETISQLEAEVSSLRDQVTALQQQVRDLGGVPIGTPTDGPADTGPTTQADRDPPDQAPPNSVVSDTEDPDPENGQGPSPSSSDEPPTIPDEVCVGSLCYELPDDRPNWRDTPWTRTQEPTPRSNPTSGSTSTRAKGPTPPRAAPTTTSPTSTTTPARSSHSSASPKAHPRPETGHDRVPVGAVDRRDPMHRRS